MGKLRTKITSPIAKFTSPRLSDTTFFARWHGKTGPFKITTKAEGRTESRSSCYRWLTIYCIKALVRGLKGIAFHGNNEIITCTVNPLLSPPSQISPLPLISPPPPFQGKKWLVISLPSSPFPSIKQVQMGQLARLYHHERGPGVLLCCFHLDGMQVYCSFPYPYAIPYLFSGWSVEAKDFKFIDIFLLLK